jgi:hypothetical protein
LYVFGYGNAGPLKVNDTWYEFSQNVEERAIHFDLNVLWVRMCCIDMF